MLPNWLDTRPSIAFGEMLARSFIERMPREDGISEKKFAARTASVMERMDQQISSFKKEHGLNLYKKAKLGNAFKWTLKDSGYDPEYVDKLTDWLMTRL